MKINLDCAANCFCLFLTETALHSKISFSDCYQSASIVCQFDRVFRHFVFYAHFQSECSDCCQNFAISCTLSIDIFHGVILNPPVATLSWYENSSGWVV